MKSIQRFSLLAAGLWLIAACGHEETKPLPLSGTPVPVQLAQASSSPTGGLDISGQVVARQSANISTRIMGTIKSLSVKSGDHVKRGQVLVRISSDDLAARRQQADAMIAEAQAHLASAKKDFDRFTNLYNSQSASAKELDNVTLQYHAAEARLEAARQMRREVEAMMAYATVTAPFEGTITQKLAEEGSMASPGVPLLVLEGTGSLQVEASVPETEIKKVSTGSHGQVTVKAAGRQFDAMVTEINPSSEMSGGQYIIKLNVPASEKNGMYAGMYANIHLVTPLNRDLPKTEAVLVPTSSLVFRDQLTGLYTVSQSNTAILRWVRTGKTYGDQTEILSGLSAGEKYIARSEGKLFNGAPLSINGTDAGK